MKGPTHSRFTNFRSQKNLALNKAKEVVGQDFHRSVTTLATNKSKYFTEALEGSTNKICDISLSQLPRLCIKGDDIFFCQREKLSSRSML